MSIVWATCPLDFHHFPSVILVPLSPLHKGTIVSAPSSLLFEVLHVTCLHIVVADDFGYVCLDKGKTWSVNVVDGFQAQRGDKSHATP